MYMLQCGSSFGGTRLANFPRHITQHIHRSKGGNISGRVLVRAKKEVIDATKINHLGEHFLDNLSNYIFHQIKRPFAKYIPDNWDPLDFLPVNIQSNLQKSEAIVSPHIHSFIHSFHPSIFDLCSPSNSSHHQFIYSILGLGLIICGNLLHITRQPW